MRLKGKIAAFLITVLIAGTPVGSSTTIDQSQRNYRPRVVKKSNSRIKRDEGRDNDTNAGKLRPSAPVLWKDPGRIEDLDLYYGPSGPNGAPIATNGYKYIRTLGKGYSTKYVVSDARGKKWVVKLGEETKSETAASRIIWAMGYHTDPTYFVESARINGINGKRNLLALNVRFEEYYQGWKDTGQWSWKKNPFNNTREMQGLKVLMAFLNNWDLKDSNNTILCPENGGESCIYYVSDLGSTLGRTGSIWREIFFFTPLRPRSRGNAKDYADQKFIDGVKRGQVDFHYKGKNPGALNGVSVQSAQWIGDQLSRLSDKQLSDAFRASGFNDQEVAIYIRAFRQRVRQLSNLE